MNEMEKLIESINTFKEIEDMIQATIYTEKLMNQLKEKIND